MAIRKGENRREFPNSQLAVPDSVEFTLGMERTCSPFGDPNEDVSDLGTKHELGGIRIHKTFEIRTAGNEEVHEMPLWTLKDSVSSVSIV
jgi:hypothetical protein